MDDTRCNSLSPSRSDEFGITISTSAEAIGAVLKTVTGKPVDESDRAFLFAPLGRVGSKHEAQFHRRCHSVPAAAISPKSATWNGTRIVPAPWIEAATSTQTNVSGFGSFLHGHLFWLGRSLVDKREVQAVAAVGPGGQRVFIVPALDLVIVINAGLYRSPPQRAVSTAILNQYVLKATAAPPRSHREICDECRP